MATSVSGTGGSPDNHGAGSGAGEEEESDAAELFWERHIYYYRPPWYRPVLIIASTLSTAFAAGYQSIAVAGWLQYLLLLRFLEWDRRRLRHWIAAWLLHALGFLLAMAVSHCWTYLMTDGSVTGHIYPTTFQLSSAGLLQRPRMDGIGPRGRVGGGAGGGGP